MTYQPPLPIRRIAHAEPVSLQGKSIAICHNPTAGAAGRAAQVASLANALEQAGFQPKLCSGGEALTSIVAQEQRQQNLRGVVAAGGDGTVAHVLNQLPPGIPLAVFPLGTENLLARQVGHTADPAQAVRLWQQGRVAMFDTGEVSGRCFTQMLSCGFDAAVVAAVHSQRQGNIQRWTYAWPIFAATRSYAWPELRVTSIDFEGRTQEHVGHWVFVSNFPRYAGGLRFSPWADPHDGLLDLCILKKGGFWPAWRYLAGVYTGRHQHWADVVSERVRSVHIAADVEVPWQVDGDPGGHLPVAISVVPARLALIIHRQEGLAPSGA